MVNSFSHLPSAISHYLALSTANNRFESFKIRPRQLKWVGNLILVLFLSSTLILTSLAPFIPQRKVSASTSGKLVTVESVMAGETKQEDEQKEIDTPVAVHFDNPGAETLEMIFHKEPRVRIKIGQKEMEVTTTEIEGIGKAQPKKSDKTPLAKIRGADPENRGENDAVNAQQRQRVDQYPEYPADTADIAPADFTLKKIEREATERP